MAENPKTLRRRIRSVTSTRKITRAMEMVAAAKLRRSQMVLKAGRPYVEKLQEMLGNLAGSTAANDPLFDIREVKKSTLLIFASDRGLCGGFNNNIIEQAHKQIIAERPDENFAVYCVGKKARDYFSKRGVEIVGEQIGLGGRVDGDVARQIAKDLRSMFLSGQTDQVYLLYNTFVSQVAYKPIFEKFLPLDPEELLKDQQSQESEEKAPQAAIDYIFEPSQAELLSHLLPRYLESKIYITMATTMTAEHSARRMAMNNATKNCGELIDYFTLKMNKARQASITKEILEVVSGSEALKG